MSDPIPARSECERAVDAEEPDLVASAQPGPLKSPFPWFGVKRLVAEEVWRWLGADVTNYLEPFFGSGAVLLGRPWPQQSEETINDADGMVANFWRAVRQEPEVVAYYADWPVFENDLHARHHWLVARRESLQSRLEGDPNYCDAKIAGWWVWGQSCWLAGGSWQQGRHQRGAGFTRDRQKMVAAIELGWRVLEFTDEDLRTRPVQVIEQIRKVLANVPERD